MKHLLPLFAFLLLFGACKKEPPVSCEPPTEQIVGPPEEEPCDNIPIESVFGEPFFPEVYPLYFSAYFNPNNADEIVFLYKKEESPWTPYADLVKYNLKTKEHQVLWHAKPHFESNPKWGKTDWIVLSVQDGIGPSPSINIYKIKSNGEGLQALTTSGAGFVPEFNITGERIVFWEGVVPDVSFPVMDIASNEVVDSFGGAGTGNASCWQHESFMAYGNGFGLKLIVPYTGELIFLYEDSNLHTGNPWSFGATWLDESHVLWCAPAGVYVTDIDIPETKKLFENCLLRSITMPCYAPSIDKVLFSYTKRVRDEDDPSRGLTYRSIGMMNPDGTDFEVLDIDLE